MLLFTSNHKAEYLLGTVKIPGRPFFAVSNQLLSEVLMQGNRQAEVLCNLKHINNDTFIKSPN